MRGSLEERFRGVQERRRDLCRVPCQRHAVLGPGPEIVGSQALLQKRTELQESVGTLPGPPATLRQLQTVLRPDGKLRRRERGLYHRGDFDVALCHG